MVSLLPSALASRPLMDGLGTELSTRLRKRQAAHLISRAQALQRQGRMADALRTWKRVVRLHPTQAAYLALGRLQAKLGDYSGALRTTRWLEAHGHDRAAEQVRGLLRKP